MKKLSLLGLMLLLVLSGCSLLGAAPPPTLVPDEAESFATQVDAMSENLLIAMNNRDEATFLQDMDDDMRKASEGGIDELYQSIVVKIGKYIPGSKKVVKVDETEGYRRVSYDATFEQEEHVQVLVVYSMDSGQPLVSGLWFDSPKLRQ
jgi:hypothetical protein